MKNRPACFITQYGKYLAALLAVLIAAGSLLLCCRTVLAQDLMYAGEIRVQVDGEEVTGEVAVPVVPSQEDTQEEAAYRTEERTLTLGVYTDGIHNVRYLSLQDLSALLNGTQKQFLFAMDHEWDRFTITTGQPWQMKEPVMVPVPEPQMAETDWRDNDGNIRNEEDQIIWTAEDQTILQRPEAEYLDLYLNPLAVDGEEVRYYSYQLSDLQDLYMHPVDAQLMLGISIRENEDGSWNILTDRGADIQLEEYDREGYFDLFNGVILGDATTGEVLYGCKETNPDAIASTSKLMTYMVVARFMELGRISPDDVVTISANAEALSKGGYGSIWMDAGQQATVRDLLGALLLLSSNESALALAEYVAGTEEAFADLMNEMARLLDLDSARFYNAHGLPDYADSVSASVRQNRMSAQDLFRLSAAVLRKYPQITEYTASRSMYLESFDITAVNTNYLLFNMPDAIGMKTGTTDEAGCCLVAAARVDAPDGEHILVAVVLGALSNLDRYQVPQLLLTWGSDRLRNLPKASIAPGK